MLFFLLIDTTFASDNYLRFRKSLLERIQKLIMTTGDKIIDKKPTIQHKRRSSKDISIIIY